MSLDVFTTATVIFYVVYVCVTGLWTNEFYRIQELGQRFKVHAVFSAIIASAALGAWTTLGAEYQLGTAYLTMPVVYLFLLVAASKWTQARHGRRLIRATKNNMQSEETKDASFSDYMLFLGVHVTPLILPLALFD